MPYWVHSVHPGAYSGGMPRLAVKSCCTLLLAVAASAGLAGPPDDPVHEGVPESPEADFSRDIRPILVTKCFACHGPDADARKARLRLDERSGPIERKRPVIIPGDAEASLLMERIRAEHSDDRMPPSGEPLNALEIEKVRTWINAGAPYEEHWSWIPISDVSPPGDYKNDSPIDAFIRARLDEVGLQPALPASPATQLRRLSYDLTGLPPDPEDLESFIQSPTESRYLSMVERYLQSPQFGEHWARHWLDLVRYAETRGHEFDYAIPEAWRYRDWVVRAFNADLPYNRFIAEQVAGDLLEPRPHPDDQTNEAVVGTAFWYLGQEVHAPVDVVQDEADRVGNQMEVLGQGILGLTVACARCHDHKFDAISTNDYYALTGFAQSIRQGQAYQDPGGTIGVIVEQLRAAPSPNHDGNTTPASIPGTNDPEAIVMEEFDYGDSDVASRWRNFGHAFDRCMPTEMGTINSGALDNRLHGSIHSRDFTIEKRYVHMLLRGHASKVRLVVEGMRMNSFNALLFEGYIQDVGKEEPVGWTRVVQDARRHPGTSAYIELIDDGNGWIEVDSIWFSDQADGLPPGFIAPVETARLQSSNLVAEIPAPRRVLAAHEGFSLDQHVYIRGNHRTPGEMAHRSFINSISGAQQPLDESQGSGRLVLLKRIFDEENPFPSRVMANRIWHHLTGRGIVASTDDFGGMGTPPTHPDLLDWLAQEFRGGDSPWSIKDLIRTIVVSDTYRRSSAPVSVLAESVDPNNDLLATARLRRLNAESIRDSMLEISGQLNEQVGGPPVAIHLTEFMTGRGRPGNSGPVDGNRRRSLYLGVHRNFANPMLAAFDRPIPATTVGRRDQSNVPAQALVLMNDPFVHQMARAWAQRILADENLGDDKSRIRHMSLQAFGRTPDPREFDAMYAFTEAGPRQDAEQWSDLAHAMFNSKAFIYLE